ncbi:hypothetical protein [Methanoculleus bourgensis]|uniref:Uncharacterized protein n=1 Tax=Methanoculleus bourgensis TaxID=83986 RepID=A0A0X3BM83_9EURY|nr:hypothetical protein [Methanoculleus bourgensis]CVK33019.1 protein of unknown function [Methanoculleus bourgensis]
MHNDYICYQVFQEPYPGEELDDQESRGCSPAGTGRRTIECIAGVLIAILVLIPVAAAAPTVIVSNYTVTPAVLMPGDEGTITWCSRAPRPQPQGRHSTSGWTPEE